MFKVNVFIDTDIKGFKRQTAWYVSKVEFIKKDGSPERRSTCSQITGTRDYIVLVALLESLKRLNKQCDITLSVDNRISANLRRYIQQKTYMQWKLNGWVTVKNEPVANKEEWQQLEELLSKYNHKITFAYNEKNENHKENVKELTIKKGENELWEQQKLLQ